MRCQEEKYENINDLTIGTQAWRDAVQETNQQVLDLVNTYSKVNNVDIPYKIVERRPGDIATCYADPTRAKIELGWVAEKNLEDMCRDSWNFVKGAK